MAKKNVSLSKPFLHFNFGGYEAFLAHISLYSLLRKLRKLFLFVGQSYYKFVHYAKSSPR